MLMLISILVFVLVMMPSTNDSKCVEFLNIVPGGIFLKKIELMSSSGELLKKKMNLTSFWGGTTTSFFRRTLSLVGVRAQASLLLGRLEEIGPGAAAAACRRNLALQMERTVANQRRADALWRIQGKSIFRRGQCKID